MREKTRRVSDAQDRWPVKGSEFRCEGSSWGVFHLGIGVEDLCNLWGGGIRRNVMEEKTECKKKGCESSLRCVKVSGEVVS